MTPAWFDDDQFGEALDRELGERYGLHFNPDWNPVRRRPMTRTRWQRFGFIAASMAVAGILSLPWIEPLPEHHVAIGSPSFSSLNLPVEAASVVTALGGRADYQVEGMTPVYGDYPVDAPTGRALSLSGSFHWRGISGTQLILQLDTEDHVQRGVLFAQSSPVYTFWGDDVQRGRAIPTVLPAQPARGWWFLEGTESLTSFSAAGDHVYVTHGARWADLVGHQKDYWANVPRTANQAVINATIAGLPTDPLTALLVEELPSGLRLGYITRDGGRHWQAWGLGEQNISGVMSLGSYFWAIFNGSVARSTDGRHWTTLLALNTARWQVESFAVNPANPQNIVVALIPVAGQGTGPVLETTDGGVHWHPMANFPAVGRAPSAMAMNAHQGIVGLVNLNGPVVVQYQPSSRRWQLFPVPAGQSASGLGQLAEAPNGNILYGAPDGTIYEWLTQNHQWVRMNPPPGADPAHAPAQPLQAIGNQQILAGYNHSWYIFWQPANP